MRPSLLGLNAFATAVLATPALLIYASSGHVLGKTPLWAALVLVSIAAGCLSLFVAMARIGCGDRTNALSFVLPLAIGAVLVMAPIGVLVLSPQV